MSSVPLARLDSDGDGPLAGPVLHAVAASVDRVVLLCGQGGRSAAELLPGVDEVLVWHCPWIDAEPLPMDRARADELVTAVADRQVHEALVLTSYHQSPLPLALLLRLAGVAAIAAVSDDYPGSLLDVRHQLPQAGLHEVQRMLSLAAVAGFALPVGDDGALMVREPPDSRRLTGDEPYVVVHPGASVPARAPSPARAAAMVDALVAAGRRVVVTGGPAERRLTALVAGGLRDPVLDLGGRTDLAELAGVLQRADAVVVGNTGPAHLAAAVGTPVVSLFAPTVPAERWRPWRVPHVLLGDVSAGCAGSRARTCPVRGHPCLDGVPLEDVVDAVAALANRRLVEAGR
ncbi:MAG: glycosyltransferase family 9 protein [Mycobacteriales bacterium]